MIGPNEAKTVRSWATSTTDFNKVLKIGDNLKGIGAGKTLAILAPSYLMRKIDYRRLIDSPKVHTMSMNKAYLMPGSDKLNYYLPFTTAHKTKLVNADKVYVEWMNKFTGLVMHGIHHNDGTNATTPYILATHQEVKDIIIKTKNTKFMVWHHSWGDYVKRRGVPGMLEFPYYDLWTPRRLPWAHCGALCGFAIPMGLALGYSKIYVVGMGYRYVIDGWHSPKTTPTDQTKIANDPWLQFAPQRMSNQAKLAKDKGIILKVGPESIIESDLKKFYDTFKSIDEIL